MNPYRMPPRDLELPFLLARMRFCLKPGADVCQCERRCWTWFPDRWINPWGTQ